MGDVVKSFLEPLMEVYPLPKHANTNSEKFFGVYVQMLGSFGDDVLSAAAADIMANRTARTFPLPAECNAVCKHAVDTVKYGKHEPSKDGNRHEHLPFEQRYPDWSERRISAANALVCCQIGREALAEKWIVSLHDFCRENQRLPDRHEMAVVRKKGIAVQKDFEDMAARSQPNSLLINLVSLRRSMFDRLEKAVNA